MHARSQASRLAPCKGSSTLDISWPHPASRAWESSSEIPPLQQRIQDFFCIHIPSLRSYHTWFGSFFSSGSLKTLIGHLFVSMRFLPCVPRPRVSRARFRCQGDRSPPIETTERSRAAPPLTCSLEISKQTAAGGQLFTAHWSRRRSPQRRIAVPPCTARVIHVAPPAPHMSETETVALSAVGKPYQTLKSQITTLT